MTSIQIFKDYLTLQLLKDEISFKAYFQIMRRMAEANIQLSITKLN